MTDEPPNYRTEKPARPCGRCSQSDIVSEPVPSSCIPATGAPCSRAREFLTAYRWSCGGQRGRPARAARYDGWSPLLIDEVTARTTRTAVISTPEQLAPAIREVRELAAASRGEGARVDVQVQTPQSKWMRTDDSLDENLDHLGRLADAGVDWFVLQPRSDSVEACVDVLTRYAETVRRR